MDAGRTGKLCQTADRILHFSRRNHHQVGKLVHDNDDLRQFFRFFAVFIRRQLGNFRIVAFHIAHVEFRKFVITVCHLRNRPVQSSGSLFRVCDNRDKKVRNAVINRKLNDLRVDHDQFDVFRFCLINNTHNQRVDADRFTGTGRTGDQKMRHFRDICDDRLTGDVFSDSKGQIRRKVLKLRCFKKITQHHGRVRLIWNLDSDCGFSRDRCLNADICCCKTQLDIVGQSDNPAYFHALFRHQLIPCDGRSAAYVIDCNFDTEAVQRLLQFPRYFPQMRIGIAHGTARPFFQKIHRRCFVLRPLFLCFFPDFLTNAVYIRLDLFTGRPRISRMIRRRFLFFRLFCSLPCHLRFRLFRLFSRHRTTVNRKLRHLHLMGIVVFV